MMQSTATQPIAAEPTSTQSTATQPTATQSTLMQSTAIQSATPQRFDLEQLCILCDNIGGVGKGFEFASTFAEWQ